MTQLKTLQELYPTATREQILAHKTALIRDAIENGYVDEDTYDAEAMADRYDAYEDYKNDAVRTLNAR